MVIEYGNSKEVKCYRDFVLNPDNRNASRTFAKTFGTSLMKPAKKLHDRLKIHTSAGTYNAVYGQTDNRIEIKQGCKGKEPLILKVRVDRVFRKFFNHIADSDKNLFLTQDWKGDFNAVTTIHVIAVNNHDYKSV